VTPNELVILYFLMFSVYVHSKYCGFPHSWAERHLRHNTAAARAIWNDRRLRTSLQLVISTQQRKHALIAVIVAISPIAEAEFDGGLVFLVYHVDGVTFMQQKLDQSVK
jgi:hypothetical protein